MEEKKEFTLMGATNLGLSGNKDPGNMGPSEGEQRIENLEYQIDKLWRQIHILTQSIQYYKDK